MMRTIIKTLRLNKVGVFLSVRGNYFGGCQGLRLMHSIVLLSGSQ